MTKEDYQDHIPHTCHHRTVEAHWNVLLLCWGITHGKIKKRGVEGPHYCHECPESVRAERLDRMWERKIGREG